MRTYEKKCKKRGFALVLYGFLYVSASTSKGKPNNRACI